MPEIRDFDLKLLVERWLRELLSESEHHRWEMSPHSEAGRQEVLRELSYWETTYREALGRGDLEMTKEQAALLLREKDVQIASDAPEVRVVARELLKASIVAVKEEQRRFRGEFDEATILPSRVSSAGSVVPVKNVTAIPEPIPLSKALTGTRLTRSRASNGLRRPGRRTGRCSKRSLKFSGIAPSARCWPTPCGVRSCRGWPTRRGTFSRHGSGR